VLKALADQVRERFTESKATLRELFSRLTFNVLYERAGEGGDTALRGYLERDPETAGSAAEEGRLQRRAEQRARLCEAMTQIAAERGFEAATAQQVLLRAEIGSGTFYSLYESREACLLEAFERCADAVLARVVDAVAKGRGDLHSRLEAGLGALIELLDAHPDVARLLLATAPASEGLSPSSRPSTPWRCRDRG
jgi:AcrR family transcriptional regulator